MNDQQRAAMQAALDAMRKVPAGGEYDGEDLDAAIVALEAALAEPQPDEPVGALPPPPDLGPEWTDYWSNKVNTIMRNYAQQAVEAERERCAKVCEKQFPVGDHDWRVSRAAAEKCAAAIRGT